MLYIKSIEIATIIEIRVIWLFSPINNGLKENVFAIAFAPTNYDIPILESAFNTRFSKQVLNYHYEHDNSANYEDYN